MTFLHEKLQAFLEGNNFVDRFSIRKMVVDDILIPKDHRRRLLCTKRSYLMMKRSLLMTFLFEKIVFDDFYIRQIVDADFSKRK